MASNQPTNLKDRLIKGNSAGVKTKFRSLKYESSRGFNDQPFIRTDLPGVEDDNPNIGLLGNGDFLLRAGSLERTADDTARLSKFFTTTQGAGFIAKQNLLSKINVKPQGGGVINQGVYLPTNTLAQIGVSAAGGHLVKQGINPLRDLTSNQVGNLQNVEGDGFLAKAANAVSNGLSIANQETTFPVYLQNVTTSQPNDENRLINLRDSKISSPVNNDADLGSGLGNLFRQAISTFGGQRAKAALGRVNDILSSVPGGDKNNISPRKDEILNYGGGPGAYLGIGRTILQRYSDTNSYNNEAFRRKYYLLSAGELQARADQAIENPGVVQEDFRKDLLPQQESGEKKNLLTDSPSYKEKNIETRVGLGDPGTSQKNLKSYTLGSGLGPVDQVNSLPLYESEGVTANPRKNDFVKFRFAVPDVNDPKKKTYIHFRAFISGISDNYSSTWNTIEYMGRTDKMYRFGGYDRTVVMSWVIAAQSREELMVMYTKLNYLQSVMAGDYTDKGYMAGNFVNVTVGGYFWETPAIIQGMNISIPEDTTWEIGISDTPANEGRRSGQTIPTDKRIQEMPHRIEVTGFTFNPIHEFAPRKQQNVYNQGGTLTEFGKQRFIALTSDKSKAVSVYDKKNGKVRQDLQFDPNGLVDASKSINAIEASSLEQGVVSTDPQAMPSSEISKKLQGLIG